MRHFLKYITNWFILKENLLYPSHIHRVQALLPSDFFVRLGFLHCKLYIIVQNTQFAAELLFTDEEFS